MARGDETGPMPAQDEAGTVAERDGARRGAGSAATQDGKEGQAPGHEPVKAAGPDEKDRQAPRRPPGKAATRALGAAATAGLGAVAAAELLDPRPGNGHAHRGTSTGHAHSGNAYPGPGHTPGQGRAPDLVVAPAATEPGYPPPHPGTSQAGMSGAPGTTGQPGVTGGGAAGGPAAASGANGSAINGNATSGGAQPGQPGAALRTRAQTAPLSARLQPGLALPGTSPSGAASPPPTTPTAASGANPVSTSAVAPGSSMPAGSPATTASPNASASGGEPAAVQPLPPGSAAAAGAPTATTMPPPSAPAATAQQNAGPWSVLYDAAGNPAGIANAAGAFSPFPGTDAASASAASPLPLYDSTGQQAGTYSGASRLMPPATAAQSPWLAGTPPAYGAQVGSSVTPAGNSGAPTATAATGSPQQQAVTQVQYTSVQPSDAQINQEMLDATPAQREQMIMQGLKEALNDSSTTSDQKTAIQQALDGNIRDLPDSFYAHGDYTYTDDNGNTQTLNTLQAAAQVSVLQAQYSHFGVYIQDLSHTAHDLYAKGDDISIPAMSLGLKFAAVDKMWDLVFSDVANSSDPDIKKAQGHYTQMKANLFGDSKTPGSIPHTAQKIRDKADTLYGAAAVYAYMEETNLSQFGLQADDPRPAWEKARFTVTKVNGKPVPVDNATTGKYPPGYFDPDNPGSPFYEGLGPRQ